MSDLHQICAETLGLTPQEVDALNTAGFEIEVEFHGPGRESSWLQVHSSVQIYAPYRDTNGMTGTVHQYRIEVTQAVISLITSLRKG